MLPRPLVVAIVSLVAALWAVNVVVGYVRPELAQPGLNTLFGLIVGGAVAASGGREAVRKLRRAAEKSAADDGEA